MPDGEQPKPRRKVPLDSPQRLREVLDAALAVVADVGYERFNMDLVAQRAHVSKGSLYQRWPSKAHLLVAALDANQIVVESPDTGSFLEDVRELGRRWLRATGDGDPRGIALALLEGSRRDAELARLLSERVGQGERPPMRDIVDAATARGELPGGLDLDLFGDLPLAMVMANVLFKGVPMSDDLVDRIVDGVLAPLLGNADHTR